VASRVLNEGVDVPEASVAIVLSGTGSQREYVQRLGRILRRGEGKLALLYEVIAEATSEEQLSRRRRQGAFAKTYRPMEQLETDFSTVEMRSPLDPATLRQRVFALSAQSIPGPQGSAATLTAVAETLSHELEREVGPEQIRAWLYADLPEQQVLTSFDAPTPEALLERYNLSQAQGVLYRASHVVLTAHRNDPGEYKLLFRYVKLFGLMAYIEGDADHGF